MKILYIVYAVIVSSKDMVVVVLFGGTLSLRKKRSGTRLVDALVHRSPRTDVF